MDRMVTDVGYTPQVGVSPEDIMHPIFGEIIKDIGYKRVYCISCEKVGQAR